MDALQCLIITYEFDYIWFAFQTRKTIDKELTTPDSPNLQKPGHMRESLNGQRANIAKLFEQGMNPLFLHFVKQIEQNQKLPAFWFEGQ